MFVLLIYLPHLKSKFLTVIPCARGRVSNTVDLGRVDFRYKGVQSSRRLSVSVKVPAWNELIQAGVNEDVSCSQFSFNTSALNYGVSSLYVVQYVCSISGFCTSICVIFKLCNLGRISNTVDLGRIDFRNKATQSSRRLSVSVKVPARNDLIQAGTGNDVSCIQESLLASVHIRWGIQTWG